jgi:cytidylate kinase
MSDSVPAVAPVLAIDGPSGSGKGTVSQRLAAELGWPFLDSGAVYRALALAAREENISSGEVEKLVELAEKMEISFIPAENGVCSVVVNGTEVSEALRSEEVASLASQIAAEPKIRLALLEKQRQFQQPPGLVADGRDMGTTVFPDALLKIYLTASPEVRAERRYKQLKEKGFDVNLPRLLGEIRERDERDAGRKASPLKPADDACIVDTSDMTIDEVVEHIRALLQQRLPSL